MLAVKHTWKAAPALTLILLLAYSGSAQGAVPGDVNVDDVVNAVDVQLVINEALGMPTGYSGACDVSGDDKVNAVDVQLVINAALSIEPGEGEGEGVVVPSVLGLSRAAAESAITDAGLTVGTVTEQFSNTVSPGHVVGQDPSANATVTPGTAVDLAVSLGPGPAPGEMIYIPAGSFEMGDPWGEGGPEELPVHTVTLSAYEIGKYQVTNEALADVFNWAQAQGYLETATSITTQAFGYELLDLDAGPTEAPIHRCQIIYSGGRFSVRSRDGYSMANFPAQTGSWYGAVAYCNWLSEMRGLEPCYDTNTWVCDFSKNGYHLPTEAQWERAASWDTSVPGGRHWRYGFASDSIDCSRANYRGGGPQLVCNPWGWQNYMFPYYSPVGYYDGSNGTVDSPSPVGCYDMTGNVSDWCNDWYESSYYGSSPGTDPTGPITGWERVARGGCWFSDAFDSRSARRFMAFPHPGSHRFTVAGIRLARQL